MRGLRSASACAILVAASLAPGGAWADSTNFTDGIEPTGGLVVPLMARGGGSTGVLGVVAFPVSIPPTRPWRLGQIVQSPEVVLGKQHGREPGSIAHVAFRWRMAGRLLLPLDGDRLDAITGLGTTIEFWPLARASLSPEVGLRYGIHLGRCSEIPKLDCVIRYGTLLVRGDFFATHYSPTQVSVLASLTFL